MKAMILKQPGRIENNPLREVEINRPQPAPGEVLLKVEACGVCHTDLHTAEGEIELPKLPVIPGHQIVGIVKETGEKVKGLNTGERVGVTWFHSSCGECEYCQQGLENLCDKARFTGLHADGGYAEYTSIPADYVFAIPEQFSSIQAAPLLCAGVIGYRSLRLSEIKPGQKLGLYGFGSSAHVCIQIARYRGCEVYVFTRSKEHREHARKLGAVWAGGAEDEPPEKMDSSIIFAPAGWIVPEALRVLMKGGTVAINAIHMSPIPEFNYKLIYYEKTVRSVANLTVRDAREFLKLAAEIPVKTDVEVFPLREVNKVLKMVKNSSIKGSAVLKIGDNF
ncbi:MAG: zinc-dependent alcohol dehydrogenase family protein [Halanaerobiaceae bacterium]